MQISDYLCVCVCVCVCFVLFCFPLGHAACGILDPLPEIETMPLSGSTES